MGTGIYEIRCMPTQDRYIGSAVDFDRRWKAHRAGLDGGKHFNRHLQSAWNKYGAAAFLFRPIFLCDRKELIEKEQMAFDVGAPEYNILKVAGSCLGVKRSAETRAKLSAAKLGNKYTLGWRHTPESIAKMRANQLGVTSPTKGIKRSQEAVAATAAAHRGMKRSPETRQRIAAAQRAAWARKKVIT